MINFNEELKKYEHIITIEEVADVAMDENKRDDVLELLEYISKKIDTSSKG